MIYILDTDLLIHIIRGLKSKRRPSSRQRAMELVERCRQAQKSGDTVGLSVISVCELEFGAQNSGNYAVEMEAVNKVLVPFDVFDLDAISCPSPYGRIRHELEQSGQNIGAMDLLIAAHALALDATLISNNNKHFSRVSGLKTEKW